MAYGTDAPNGFQHVTNISQSVYNAQLAGVYRIKSGYAYSIFQGDPVTYGQYTYSAGNWTWTRTGYIHSLAEALVSIADATVANSVPTSTEAITVAQAVPILGIFSGASFQTPVAVNPIDPSSPGRAFWPGGTQTLNNQDASAFIVEDPFAVYTVQTANQFAGGVKGAGTAALGMCFGANFNYFLNPANPAQVVAPFVLGNTITGVSKAYLDMAAPTASLGAGPTPGAVAGGYRIRNIDPQNPIIQLNVNGTASAGQPYNNVWVVCAKDLWSAANSAL